jgi:transposase-like protein
MTPETGFGEHRLVLKHLPKNLLEFQQMFPDEKACRGYLWQVRWPNGFACPHCGGVSARGTVMHGTKLPLRYWFWGAYLVATRPNGISALQLHKQLNLGSYKTAWLLLNTLRRAMVNPDRKKLSNIVEVDEAYITFRSKHEPDVDSRGRSPVGKMTIAIAVEVVEFVAKNGECRTRTVRIRIEPIPDTTRRTLHGFIRRNIEPGSGLVTDGSKAYLGLREYFLKQVVGMPDELTLYWMHKIIALLKKLGLGTYHGFRRRYIRRYLDEFVWRFNRRHYRPATFHLILGLAAKTPPAFLSKITADPIDNKLKIIALPEPRPAAMPKGMLHGLQARFYRRRGLLPPEDHPDG